MLEERTLALELAVVAAAVAVAVAAAVLLASQFTASKTTFLGVGLVVLNLAPKPWLTALGVGAEAMDCSSASLAVVTSTS